MCLTINTRIHRTEEGAKWPTPLVAENDILVTKLLCSTTKKGWFGQRTAMTSMRFHKIKFGFKKEKTLEDNFGLNETEDLIYVTNGIHAFTGVGGISCGNIDRLVSTYGDVEHYAVIPKGTKYYLGVSGDIVAEKMIIFWDKDAYDNYTKDHGIPDREYNEFNSLT